MSYESIAKLVHQYVKNPKSLLSQEKVLAEREVRSSELSIIQSVFSRHEVSGNVASIGILLRSWG